jgi:hypothetical protein
MIWIVSEKDERGEAALAALPSDCEHPDVLVARAMLVHKRTMREPEGDALDAAIRFHFAIMDKLAGQGLYRLGESLTDLVTERVRPPDVERERALLEKALDWVERENRHRPECPGPYYALYRLHRLLGHAEKAAHFKQLHDRKKTEWEHKPRYDEQGRPRCR